MQVKHTVRRLLFEGNLYGEWWIEDGGNVEFADGDVGDQNHESLAFQSALGIYFEEFGETEQEIDDSAEDILSIVRQNLTTSAEVAEEFGKHIEDVGPVEAADYFKRVFEDIVPGNLTDIEAAILLGIGASAKAIKWFQESSGDAREYMMLEENWIRVQGYNFQMGTFDDDAKRRIGDFLYDPGGFEAEKVMPGEESIVIEEFLPKENVIEADIHDILNPHMTANQIKKKERQPAGLPPGAMFGGGEPQL